jgi:hypothetical protein
MEVHPESDDAAFAPPTRREALVPAFAVGAVAVVALTAAVMVKRGETEAPVAAQQAAAPIANVPVVHAPPLKPPATNAMGGAAACSSCGVVQMVVAVRDRGAKDPRAFQMHVRMDDGTVRTIEQRGALAAGSRVVVDGNSIKPMS